MGPNTRPVGSTPRTRLVHSTDRYMTEVNNNVHVVHVMISQSQRYKGSFPMNNDNNTTIITVAEISLVSDIFSPVIKASSLT